MTHPLHPDDRMQAHVDLLRAVDRLLIEAEIVRARRAVLDRSLAAQLPHPPDARPLPEEARRGD